MKLTWVHSILTGMVLGGCSAIAQAQDATPMSTTLPTAAAARAVGTSAADTMFPKHLWTMQFTGGYYCSVEAGEDGVGPATLSANYYFDTRHAAQIDLVGYDFENDNDREDAIGIGLNLGLRYHFFEYERLTLFVDGAAGLFQADHAFPEGGTHFNFTEQVGLGATFRLNENAHLIAGARFVHISNAAIQGREHNPSFNGAGGYVGVLFTF